MKKRVIAFSLGSLITSSAYADIADWTGTFLVDNKSQTIYIQHTPTNVDLNHMLNVGKCLTFGKGASFNGIKFNDDIHMCTQANVDTFTAEVEKIGLLISHDVKLGPNYTSN